MRHSKNQEQKKQHVKGKVTVMKKGFFKKGMIVGALALAVMAGSALFGSSAKASAAIKCYTILPGNTTVYSNTGLTRKYGTIFGSDQITVNQVTDRYCKVTFPILRGTKTGYIRTGAILTKTMGNSYKSRAKITTYRRPGGGSYGYVSNGDTVKVLGTYGSYTQLKYSVNGGGYKYAFVSTSSYNAYIKPASVSVPSTPGISTNNVWQTVKITSYGQTVDTLNGVPAQYIPGLGNSNTGTYCCARYVSNYYKRVYGVKVANMFTERTPSASRGYFYRTSNPKVGDVGYQLNSGHSGHWFIIKAVNGDGTFTVIEQNWKFGNTYCYKNRRVSFSTKGFKVFRWFGR